MANDECTAGPWSDLGLPTAHRVYVKRDGLWYLWGTEVQVFLLEGGPECEAHFTHPQEGKTLCESCSHEVCSGLGTDLVATGGIAGGKQDAYYSCSECSECRVEWGRGERRPAE